MKIFEKRRALDIRESHTCLPRRIEIELKSSRKVSMEHEWGKKKQKKTKQSFIKERLKKGSRKSVFKKNIQSGIPRSDIGSVCHITKEEKIKDSGNKTSLWLVIFVRVVYIGYIIVVSNSRRGRYFKIIISIN